MSQDPARRLFTGASPPAGEVQHGQRHIWTAACSVVSG